METLEKEAVQEYDYILDKNNWFHLVKLVLEEGTYITKPIHYCGVNHSKYKTRISSASPPCGTRYIIGSPFDFKLTESEVSSVVSPIELKLKSGNPHDVLAIREFSKSVNSKALLFGSRLIGKENSTSDWDLLIDTHLNPLEFVNLLVTKVPNLRRFTKPEIYERSCRYKIDSALDSSDVSLNELFDVTTIYLKSQCIGEIGIFFRNSLAKKMDYSKIKNYGSLVTTNRSIIGKIAPSLGKSFHLPRRFTLKTETDEEITIHSTVWELSGLEAMNGRTVSVRNAIKLNNQDDYFAFGHPSSIKIHKG